jgi:GrpB-like predicted nucleotidyltransferase (UPF0157 family)
VNPETSVVIVDYDAAWPARFEELASRVRAALGDLVLRVEHIGSTAVSGLAAKPIIDLDVVVGSPADVAPAIRKLSEIGYVHEGDLGIDGREAFRSQTCHQQHHLYLLVEGAQELARHLAFRDALRVDPALRDAYSKLKRSLAAEQVADRAAYTRGKSDFVLATLAGGGLRKDC